MLKSEIFAEIQKERTNQDTLWPRDERRKVMYGFSAPHLLLLEEKIAVMRTQWYKGEISPIEFTKVAAIATRALEEITDESFWARNTNNKI